MIPLWLIPYKKHLLIGLAAVLLVGTAYLYVYGKGFEKGKEKGVAEQVEADAKRFQEQFQAFKSEREKWQAAVSEADSKIAAQDEKILSLEQKLSRIVSDRQQNAQRISSLSQEEILSTVRTAINSTLTSPTLTSEEERKVAAIVTDYPLLKEENSTLHSTLTETNTKIGALEEKVNALSQEQKATLTFTREVVGHYEVAYNALQKEPSLLVKILTLGMKKKKTLNIPSPESLKDSLNDRNSKSPR